MATGFYSYEKLEQLTHGHPFEIILTFEPPKSKKIDATAGDNTHHEVKWRKDEISDFEQKLALVDNIKGKDEHIQDLIKWNEVAKDIINFMSVVIIIIYLQIAKRLLIVIEKLHELGSPEYEEFCSPICINDSSIEIAEKRVRIFFSNFFRYHCRYIG